MPSREQDHPDEQARRRRKGITFILTAFILGLLCSTHPKQYLRNPQPPEPPRHKSHSRRRYEIDDDDEGLPPRPRRSAIKKDNGVEESTDTDTSSVDPANKRISPENPPSELSRSTKASVSSRASSFAQLLNRRTGSSILKLAKKASKSIRSSQQQQEQTIHEDRPPASPKIIEISSPVRPDLSRSITNPETSASSTRVNQSLLVPSPSNNSRTGLKRPSAHRIRSAFELQSKTPPTSQRPPIQALPQQSNHTGPYARRSSLELRQSHSSEEAPLYLTRSASPIFGHYQGFDPRHIKESTIEEDADHSEDAGPITQTPRLGTPLSPTPPDDLRKDSKRKSKFFDRLRRRGESEDSTEAQRLTQVALDHQSKTPGSIRTASSHSSCMSYFQSLREHSSEASPVSPKTVKPSLMRASESSPRSTGTLLDIKGWLDSNRASPPAGSAAKHHMHSKSIDMTTPGSPSFLPSEMRRINTPPLQPAVTVRKQRSIYRGLHLDRHQLAHLNASDELGLTPSTPVIKPLMPNPPIPYYTYQPSRNPERRRQRLSDQEMDQQGIDQIMNEPEADQGATRSRVFSLDIPAHLPNSPLCPLHPKHAGGPKPLCPMHGRARKGKAPVKSQQEPQQ
ncbi:hypothetical protein MBLNU457_6537t2 [Dothideomycetes sp. NU457]